MLGSCILYRIREKSFIWCCTHCRIKYFSYAEWSISDCFFLWVFSFERFVHRNCPKKCSFRRYWAFKDDCLYCHYNKRKRRNIIDNLRQTFRLQRFRLVIIKRIWKYFLIKLARAKFNGKQENNSKNAFKYWEIKENSHR